MPTYLKGKIKSGGVVRKPTFIKEIADLSGVDEQEVIKVVDAYTDCVIQHIALEDHLNLGFAIVGGRTLPPKKFKGSLNNVVISNDPTRRGYTSAKTGRPFIYWNEEVKRNGREIHPAIFYLDLVPMKYTTDAYWFRKELGYPEISEYEGLTQDKILELCSKADEIVFGTLNRSELAEKAVEQKMKIRKADTEWIRVILADLDRQRRRGVAEEDLEYRDPELIIKEREREVKEGEKLYRFFLNNKEDVDLSVINEYKRVGYRFEFLTPKKREELEAIKNRILKEQDIKFEKSIENGNDKEISHLRELLVKNSKVEDEQHIMYTPEDALEKFTKVNRFLNILSKTEGIDKGADQTEEVQYALLKKELNSKLDKITEKRTKYKRAKEKAPGRRASYAGKKEMFKESVANRKKRLYKEGLEKALAEGKTEEEYKKERAKKAREIRKMRKEHMKEIRHLGEEVREANAEKKRQEKNNIKFEDLKGSIFDGDNNVALTDKKKAVKMEGERAVDKAKVKKKMAKRKEANKEEKKKKENKKKQQTEMTN